ncbi:MAG: ATP-dependent DNA helicase RecG [Bacillota bacterium]|nr:ATP-dependent DNA helicase RecG [Bacillota bacterium]
MNDLLQLIDKELHSGCLDSSVFGGFTEYLRARAEKMGDARLAGLAEQYRQASAAERPQLLAQMRQALASAPSPAPAPSPTPSPTPFSRPVGGGGNAPREPSLAIPIRYLKGVGEYRASLYARLNVHTVGELLQLYPRDYQDRRQITPIAVARIGESCTICGIIAAVESISTRRRKHILKVYIRDDSGMIPALWFNQPFLQKKLTVGRQIYVSGKLDGKYDQLSFSVSDYALAGEEPSAGIAPVYRATEGLTQKTLRRDIRTAYNNYGRLIAELLPQTLLDQHQLIGARQALAQIHFPEQPQQAEQARRRLAYEELLILQLAMLANRPANHSKTPRPPVDDKQLLADYCATLPYRLTAAQQRVIAELYADINSPAPMSRLVQGDVGCGKTAVAAAALHKACQRGGQAAMMAPTELLARQHFATLQPQMRQLGLTAELLTGSTTAARRRRILADLSSGALNIIIGTHALLQDDVVFADLRLAVSDEQHRFGVAQRARLRGGDGVDLLVMSATPIPRTLAMTLYADLELSLIDELPAGRLPVKTYAVEFDMQPRVNAFIEKQLAAGRQAFVVCPLIEESESLDLASATEHYQQLRDEVFPDRRVALLHGKLKAREKQQIMEDFAAGNTDILVSTTVIEVGIDVPNATLMVIRNAERFGLAQLHQLRGRIVRGREQGYCLLMHQARTPESRRRIQAVCEHSNGLKLAEADLQLRGAGDFFGTQQHGVREMKIADVFRDAALLAAAHHDAKAICDGRIAVSEQLWAAVRAQYNSLP